MKIRLRYLLISTFLLLSFIPLISGFQFLINFTGEQFHQQVENKLEAISKIAQKRIESVVDRVEDNTRLITSRTQLRLSLQAWNETAQSSHAEKIQKIIRDARGNMDRIRGITIYNPGGQIVASTFGIPDQDKVFEAPDDLVRIQILNGEKPTLSSVSRLMLDGETVGFAEILFVADFLLDLINDRTGLGTTGEWLFAVRDKDGNAMFAGPLRYDRGAAFNRIVSKERVDVPITQALLGNEIVMRDAPDYQEMPVLASTRYISDMDWGLVVKMNEAEVSEMIENAQTYMFWGLLALIFFGVVIGLAVAQYIAHPVEKLRGDTEKVASGDFNIEPLSRGWQEVVEFSSSFTQMVAAVRDLSENLNQKVDERTEQLDLANQKLKELAIRDSLTGLYNRRYFSERLQQEFDRARRYGDDITLVMLDLDHFKNINDTYGHAAGDAVLIGVADYIHATLRDSDLLGRLGGEEFGLLLLSGQQDGVSIVLDRLRIELSLKKFPYEGKGLSVTCSFGVVHFSPEVDSVEAFMKRADDALYEAKNSGRNKIVIFGSENNSEKTLA